MDTLTTAAHAAQVTPTTGLIVNPEAKTTKELFPDIFWPAEFVSREKFLELCPPKKKTDTQIANHNNR